jgi:capsular polysaccharide transport system permease protein
VNVNLTDANIKAPHHLISRSSFLDPGRKRHPLQIAFLLWVGVPTLLAFVYFFLYASPMYVSIAELTVRNLEGGGGGLLDSVLGKSFGVGNSQDAQIVKEFLESRQAVATLDHVVNLRRIYADSSKDVISRLGEGATNEALYNYFIGVMTVEFDSDTGVIQVKVRAFTAEQAHQIAEAMIALADDLVKNMATRAREDALAFSKQDLELAESRLRQATLSVTSFRNTGQDINPAESAKTGLGIVASLQQEIVKTRAQLAEAASYYQPSAVVLSTLKARLEALQQQLHNEQGKLTGQGVTLSESLPTYEGLNLDLELARRGYASALAALDSARKEAIQRNIYLVPFVKPDIPDEAAYPRKLLSVLTVFVAALASFGITTLVVASIREHVSL